jgi:hypothetical protein
VAYALNGNIAGLAAGFEDYNVYQHAANDLVDQGVISGNHNLYLGADEPLYTDAVGGLFTLLASSPAANLNSTGTPAYAGSLGTPNVMRLEVTHTPAAGQYGSITAALAAASGDSVVEVIDNSAPFVEQINVNKSDITLQGKAGLNPRPTVRGNATVSPYDATVGNVVMTYQNSARLTVANLILEAGTNDNVVLDARFSDGATFSNCDFKGRTGGLAALNSSGATTFNQCTFTGAGNTIIHRANGPLVLSGCQVREGSSVGLNIYGGQVQVRDQSRLSVKAATTVLMHGETAGSPPDFSLSNSILTTDHSGGNNLLAINAGATGAGVAKVAIDNCDIIGSMAGYPASSSTGAAILLNTTVASMSVVDTIFFHIASVAYALNGKTTGLTGGFEDWCVYSSAPNNLQDQGVARGLHSIGGEALYVDPAGGDFRLYDNCSAATRNSTGSPAWLGSQGPSGLKHAQGFDRTYTNLLAGFTNMYNPCVIEDDVDPNYRYKMYFFGWAANDCNAGYSGCDAIFVARSNNLNDWQVWRGNGQWDASQNPALWVPVISARNTYYDQWHNGDPSVVKKDGVYYIAYSSTGFNTDGKQDGTTGDTDGDILCVMGARSTDGINWIRSAAPLLLYSGDIGHRPLYEQSATYTGTFHRPSLMFDGDHWRLWFDYWAPGPKGVCMGLAECASGADPMVPANWTIVHDLATPIIQEWVNPTVVKFDGVYHSFADPSGYNNMPGWPNRQCREATSTDGVNWTKVPFFVDPDPDTQANQVPQASVLHVAGRVWLYMFYACQIGGPLDNYNYRYDRIRAMRRDITPPNDAAGIAWHDYH